MNNILWKCCEYIDCLKPELPNDMKSILLYLHVLVSFTSTNTWAALKHKNMEVLKSGMNQLCSNLMGQLFHRGFYLTLKVGAFISSFCFGSVSGLKYRVNRKTETFVSYLFLVHIFVDVSSFILVYSSYLIRGFM